jgi:nitrite reductase/ring-hydroxylating ferredoxin subunit
MSAPAPTLHEAGVYRRRVSASPARIWENVYDWEHLPSLHETTFRSVNLVEADGQDWTVRFSGTGREGSETIRLCSDRDAGRYVVTTLEGAGVGSEIRVQLQPVEAHVTDIEVRYFVPEARPERLSRIGAAFVSLYERLWDEDEAMMQLREARLQARRSRGAPEPVLLGSLEDVEASLPLTVDVGGTPFRLLREGGELLAHATTCPHWLGPLDDAPVVDGVVRCPWHGWRFDVRTGENLDGHACRLAIPPRVSVEAGQVWLRP